MPLPPTTPLNKQNNSVGLPLIQSGTAFGNWTDDEKPKGFTPEGAWRSVTLALSTGLTAFDCAFAYGTHRAVGTVLGNHFASGELERDGVFIATKVAHPDVAPPMYMDPDVSFNPAEVPDVRARIFKDYQQSLNDLGVGYVDLLLLHWPGAFGETDAKVARAKRAECWRALEELLASRRVRAIGVCNYTKKHLVELMEDTTIVPAVNQIEFHPYCQDHELIAFCQENEIVVEAYAPMGSGALNLPADPTIVRIAGEVGKTPGQVILRFATQQGIAVLPKSSKASRMAENQAIFDFDLSPEQLQAIKDLHKKGEEAKRTCADPATIV